MNTETEKTNNELVTDWTQDEEITKKLDEYISGVMDSPAMKNLEKEVDEYTQTIQLGVTEQEHELYKAYRREYMRNYRKNHPEYKLKEIKRIAKKYREQLQAAAELTPERDDL